MAFVTGHAHNGKAVLSESEEILIQCMFDYLDSNRDGQLTISQAVTLFGLLGYPPAKAEFKSYNVTLEDFLYVVNAKKRAGQLGRDDLEGRARRLFHSMDPRVTTRRMSFEKFRDFMKAMELKAGDDITRNMYDTMCAQLYYLETPSRFDCEDSNVNNSFNVDSRAGLEDDTAGQGAKEAAEKLPTQEGFTDDDFVEFITSTQPRCRRPPVPVEKPADIVRERGL